MAIRYIVRYIQADICCPLILMLLVTHADIGLYVCGNVTLVPTYLWHMDGLSAGLYSASCASVAYHTLARYSARVL